MGLLIVGTAAHPTHALKDGRRARKYRPPHWILCQRQGGLPMATSWCERMVNDRWIGSALPRKTTIEPQMGDINAAATRAVGFPHLTACAPDRACLPNPRYARVRSIEWLNVLTLRDLPHRLRRPWPRPDGPDAGCGKCPLRRERRRMLDTTGRGIRRGELPAAEFSKVKELFLITQFCQWDK